MNGIFSGLLLYEVVLLILGVFLFLILSIGLMYYIIKKEQFKKLLSFFAIPIIMIGYPSIKEVSISKDRILLTKYQEEYIDNPTDSTAREKVAEYTTKLESRASNAEDLVQISRSKLLLGDHNEAAELADKAIAKESTNQEAKTIKNLTTLEKAALEEPEETTINPARNNTLNTAAAAPIEENASTSTNNITGSNKSLLMDSVAKEIPVSEEVQRLTPFLSEKTVSRLNQFTQ